MHQYCNGAMVAQQLIQHAPCCSFGLYVIGPAEASHGSASTVSQGASQLRQVASQQLSQQVSHLRGLKQATGLGCMVCAQMYRGSGTTADDCLLLARQLINPL